MTRPAIPISRETLEKAAELNRKGRHLNELAADLGISPETLSRRLAEMGIPKRGRRLKDGVPPEEMDMARQAVEAYKSGLSFTAVAAILKISERCSRFYVHTLAPEIVRGQVLRPQGDAEEQPAPRPRKETDHRARCRRCEIVLAEVGDADDAGICSYCRQELAYMRNKARKATGKAARFYATYLEQGDIAA
jgi:hypothetical protein